MYISLSQVSKIYSFSFWINFLNHIQKTIHQSREDLKPGIQIIKDVKSLEFILVILNQIMEGIANKEEKGLEFRRLVLLVFSTLNTSNFQSNIMNKLKLPLLGSKVANIKK